VSQARDRTGCQTSTVALPSCSPGTRETADVVTGSRAEFLRIAPGPPIPLVLGRKAPHSGLRAHGPTALFRQWEGG
jgi:hypothetical protein